MAATKNTKAFYNTEIPSDWEVMTLGEMTTLLTNGFVGKAKEHYVETEDGVLYIQGYNISDAGFNFNGIKKVSKAFHVKNSKSCLQEGDLLTIQTGEIGLTSVVPKELIGANCHALVISRLKPDIANPNFFVQYFNSEIGKRKFKTIETGSTMKHLNVGDMDSLEFPLPPLPEQKAIAQVLSTADAAIHTTEKLIAQKELRKKWLMQQLLTGKKRLLNDELGMINDEWKPIRIGDVFKFIKSYSISREGLQNDDEGSVYCIHYGDIHAKYENSFLDFERQKNIPQLIDENISIEDGNYLQDGDIVMADASEDYEGVGVAVEIKNLNGKKAIGGLHTLVLRADKKTISPDFAAYFFSSERVRNTLRKYATGTSVYSVTKTHIHNLSFIIPNSLKEQTAIAQVLQAADKEISLLKAKAEKLREQKKGLMQVLLTGKVRLKIENE